MNPETVTTVITGPPTEDATPKSRPPLEIALRDACLIEVHARKAGNVHSERGFEDVDHRDFLRSTAAIVPVLVRSAQLGPARAILESVRAMRSSVGKNTHLGTILLLAPLAAVPSDVACKNGIQPVLDNLPADAAGLVYEAIRLAQPGGLGRVDDQDLSDAPTVSLIEAMALAADRDLVARQYVNGFADVMNFGVPCFIEATKNCRDWEHAVIRLQLELMSRYPDSLILRKGGTGTAEESKKRAAAVLEAERRDPCSFDEEFAKFDDWLRSDRHRRNPGTTADLIIATLFVALREGHWSPPPGLITSRTAEI